MDKERWAQLRALVQQAQERPAAQRADWLAAQCGDDEALRSEAQALLEHLDAGTAFDHRMQDAIGLEAQALKESERLGEALGPYRLVRKIDEGGMGSVYLGERADEAYRSQVAVKLLRTERGGEEAARRFAAERQILANLNHPYICQLLDGGTSESGQPYLVMELIDGVDIEQYCNEQRLGIRERIDLFRKV
ncbi:MAG: protein kinase, partial [Pseudomonadota bacterium]